MPRDSRSKPRGADVGQAEAEMAALAAVTHALEGRLRALYRELDKVTLAIRKVHGRLDSLHRRGGSLANGE